MAILKCKMCGGDLNVATDEKIVECEYCGSTQTIPDGSDEKKTNLFNRANRLRMDNEFDKAAGVYESIVSEFPEEAEGYWGLVLCSYGIEYVDDAKTGKKIPTCHRTLTSSVMDDDNFNQACENADVVARGVYREEAKAIDKLQQQIISVVENEEPYDVFICYKETDDITKSRTEDSLIAQDIYTELIKEGYKVFFSRVTLRDKAGTEYEPYIYAALKSAKIMLAIGTKFDYYDAVWVKNEWSRYISMMADDSSKHLIPCFKNLDAYDIPKEFKNLQALDMGEVTFFKNLTDNVERVIPKQKEEQIKVIETVSESANATVDSLLKRVFIFLEDGNWQSANEYCEKVLDINPECAEAYLGKLMAELQVEKQKDLKDCPDSFEDMNDYQKAIRFADEKLKSVLEGYISYIKERNEEARKNSFYFDAKSAMSANTIDGYSKAIELFNIIAGWKDSDDKLIECKRVVKELTEEKEKREEEKRIYNEKYAKYLAQYPNIKRKQELEYRLSQIKAQRKELNELNEKTEVPIRLYGFGIGSAGLGLLFVRFGGEIGIGICVCGGLIVLIGILMTALAIYIDPKKAIKKKFYAVSTEENEIMNELRAIEGIPTFEQWCKEEK